MPQNPYGMPQNPYQNQGQDAQNPYAAQGNPYMNQGGMGMPGQQAPYAAPQAPVDVDQLIGEGFEALEMGDGRKAVELFNRVHFADPKNTQASLGKLMIDLRVSDRESISTANVMFENNPNYQNILYGNDEELKAKLAADLAVVRERLAKATEEEQKEAAYVSACELMNKPTSANFEKAIHIFEGILDWKDSAQRLEACAGQIEGLRQKEAAERAEKARREALARQTAAQNKKKMLMVIAAAAVALVLVAAILILTFTVFVPKSKYNNALALYEEGKLIEAFEVAQGLKNHKGATDLAVKISKDVLTQFQEYLAENDCKAAYKVLTEFGYTNDEYPMLEGYKAMAEGRYKDAVNLGMPEIFVQKGTKEVTSDMFSGITKEFKVTLPQGLTTIGDSAFSDSAVVSITIPDSVTSIGTGAFQNCKSLVGITVPDSVINIGDSAFSGSGVSKVTLSKSISTIGNETFKGCTNLEEIDIPSSVTAIGNSAFAETALKKISLHSEIKTIGTYAFEACPKLTTVSIPGGVTSLGDGAFRGCKALKSIKIPGTLTTVPTEAFTNCVSLETVNIESGIKTISASAFYGCTALAELVIPSTVTTIEASAFRGCDGIKTLTIPNSVTTLGNEVFRDCNGLISVTIPSSIKAIPTSMFQSCDSLSSINFGSGVSDIGSYAFADCASLTAVTIPSTIKTIGDGAFSKCASLGSITLPKSVTKLGAEVVSGSDNLSFIKYEGRLADWNAMKNDANWQKGARATLYVYVTDGVAVKPAT